MASPEYPPQIRLAPVVGPVNASVRLPGSKSITNRALLLAALADGESILRDPLHSEDTLYMAQALRDLGVGIAEAANGDYTVRGAAGQFAAPAKPLFVGNSGTTVRFLTAAACLTPPGTDVVLDGVARMRERPIRDLVGALLTLGVDTECLNGHGCPPVRVRGGGMAGGTCRLRGDISSQFLSALLQVAPYAVSDVQIDIVGELISQPYIDITQAVMHAFGVEMENDAYRRLTVNSGQRYAARDFTIEADASNASYFLAAAAVTGGTVTLENLGSDSIQGDVQFVRVLEEMGCQVTHAPGRITLAGPTQLRALSVDMEAMPDMAQTLAVVAAFADGPSRINGLASLRVKETDRLQAVARELPKLGVGVEEGRDYWVIRPPTSASEGWHGGEIDTYDDHRMAMAFAVATLRIPDVIINEPRCVAKTFPDFWQRWQEAFGTETHNEFAD
jgi:3-phosphoshikimate 1-carboxyvinyltransferase